MKQNFILCINGVSRPVEAEPESLLIDLVREDLRLTGTKRGCGIGVCGTCTVLINGEARLSCRVRIKDVGGEGDTITTIEGLEKEGQLHPIQQAFIDCGAIQCGFCTPGMVLTAKSLLDKNPTPTRDEIKKAITRNLCRCTGYQQIFEAIEEAGRRLNPH